jgi:ABC-2 type transport system permease protein
MWLLLFGFMFRQTMGGISGQQEDYLRFLFPGVCVMTLLFGASQSGISLIRDMQSGYLHRIFRSPIHPLAFTLGKLMADNLRFLLQALILFFIGWSVSEGDVNVLALPACAAVWLLFGLSYASLSNMIALKARTQELMATFVHVFNMPLLFTSTIFIPHKAMPAWLEAIARWNPLSFAANFTRNVLLDADLPIYWQGGCVIISLLIACNFITCYTIQKLQP